MNDSIDIFFEEWLQQRASLPALSPDIQFIYRIARLSKILGQRLDRTLVKYELTRSQFEALAALRRKHPEPLCAQDLMEASLLTSGSVTAMINQMIKAQWVERDLHSEDRRRIQIRLTNKGKNKVEAVLRERIKDNTLLANLVSKTEQNKMNLMLKKYLMLLEDLESKEESKK
ncbi:MAG: MarR family transcriptional regulator [Bdellovibrio sp.]|nr:MarR family transcriptional regulator [Bdellovibrio sp.]